MTDKKCFCIDREKELEAADAIPRGSASYAVAAKYKSIAEK